jgi:ankyrin repeat protein
MAAMLGKVREIRGLLAAGAVVNAVDERGWSPLMHAATKNEFEAIEVLLKAGADPSLTNSDGLTALDLAIKTKCLDAAEFLQQHRLN